jgi:hypothetical protein
MGWMNANGMSADVLRWMEKLPPEKTATPPAAIEVADAFSAQKNWARPAPLDQRRRLGRF